MKAPRALAPVAAGAAVAMWAAAIPLLAARPGGEVLLGVVWPVPFVAMALVGGLVAARRPGNATGWLFLGAGFLMVLNGLSQAYAALAFEKSALPGAGLAAWLGLWTWMTATALIAAVLMVFPDGRPLSPRWRWAVGACLAVAAATGLAALPTLPARGQGMLEAASPFDVPGGAVLGLIGNSSASLFPLGFVAVALRFRRARGAERLQMKWFAFAAGLAALATFTLALISGEDPISTPLGYVSILLAMTAIPVSSGVAIMRYRLYEIDRIVNRTLVYGVLTSGLAAVYFGGVALLQGLLRPFAGGSDLAVVGSTLAVAALFTPARRRVQSLVDRRFYRARYDAARTLETFGATLRDEIDPEALRTELRVVVAGAMQPAHVSVWLRPQKQAR